MSSLLRIDYDYFVLFDLDVEAGGSWNLKIRQG